MTDSLPSTSARSKECAESCLDFLYIELINTYRRQQSGPATAAAVDAIGFRVGRQLAERCALQLTEMNGKQHFSPSALDSSYTRTMHALTNNKRVAPVTAVCFFLVQAFQGSAQVS